MKALMIATRPEWVKKIISGEKTFEFRNYAIPKGTKVLVYESLGKKVPTEKYKIIPIGDSLDYGLELSYKKALEYIHEHPFNKKERIYKHEGRGKVVLEFVVGECRESFKEVYYKDYLQDRYEEYLESMGYTNQRYAHTISDLIVYDEEWINENIDQMIHTSALLCPGSTQTVDDEFYDKLVGAPTEPQPIQNYIGWNKRKHLEFAPQSRVWIYMEE